MKCSCLYKEILKEKLYNFSSFNLNCIFEDVLLKKPPFTACGDEISCDAEKTIRNFCKRLAQGEPLQYILGKWEFYGLPFFVGEGVLIPRADTETIVEESLEFLKDKKNPVAADMCAGTGAIGISLAKTRKDCFVHSIELFDKAIEYLYKNVLLNEVSQNVKVIKADVLSEIDLKNIDLLVSNPPYITKEEMKELSCEVKKEPETALFGGDDGLLFYHALAKRGKEILKKGGGIIVEIGWKQSKSVEEIFRTSGFEDVHTVKDLCNNDRAVMGHLPL